MGVWGLFRGPTARHSYWYLFFFLRSREQFSFSVGVDGTCEAFISGMRMWDWPDPFPWQPSVLGGGLRAEAPPTPGGEEEAPSLPTIPAVQGQALASGQAPLR